MQNKAFKITVFEIHHVSHSASGLAAPRTSWVSERYELLNLEEDCQFCLTAFPIWDGSKVFTIDWVPISHKPPCHEKVPLFSGQEPEMQHMFAKQNKITYASL